MPKLVIQDIEITYVKASVKLVQKDGDLSPVVVFEGHMVGRCRLTLSDPR